MLHALKLIASGIALFMLGAIILVFIASQYEGHDQPAPAVVAAAPALSHDAQAVKSLREHLGNVETTYGDAMDALTNVFTKSVQGEINASNREEINEAGSSGFRIATAILKQSLELQPPRVIDPLLQTYVNQVVSAHKAWAKALQSRDTAMMSGKIERAIHFKDAADAAASQEATNLAFAYRQVGLPIE